ncbi:LysR family transcriptional regulator [Diaphorobacter sp. HDW4A]|uniref:LysR family transcriptional regulator n=1 Tax=Diaphorobacter sp. HDW4A TaxID=2714924 RepID=UPI00140CBD63|nr:LysR family transcriptional regulator [Diaphorobacter sp. HDW4A]QIL78527.1 LysR family transcriptional regulator [Diaphorobacter sp. HDW4A]
MFATDSQHADELATLLALAEKGTFVAAGDLLQRHPSVLTKRLKTLEHRLGVRLVERTTRRLHLTQEGERLVQRLREAQSLISEAEAEASQGAVQARGRLRVSIPAAMGRRVLAPMLAEFSLAHPEVVLELEYADRMVDIVGERFDAAIRIGKLADSRLVATKLSEHQRILCAAPVYLKRHGKPRQPNDLARHNCLGFTGFISYPEWKLMRGEECVTLTVNGSMISNDSETLLTAATLGVGIVGGGSWLFKPALADGSLVQVLPQWQLNADTGIYFLRPSAQFSTAAMTAFRQWVVDWFAAGQNSKAARAR